MENLHIDVDEKLQKYLCKSDLYFKLGIIKLFKEKFTNELVIDCTRKYHIKNNLTNEKRSYLCIFYQNDSDIGIKCSIFVDKKNSEFNIVFEKYMYSSDNIFDLNCSSLDLNILEQIICIENHSSLDKDNNETNIPKIKLSNIINIFTSKVIISLYTKLNQLYALYGDKPFTFIGYDYSSCYLSVFAYLYYKTHKHRCANFVSFGMPRYANLKYKEIYESLDNIKHLNIINRRDKVCAYPIFDFHHVGNVLFLENDDTMKTLSSYSQMEYLWRMSVFYCNNQDHHKLENYLRSIVSNKNINYDTDDSDKEYDINDPYVELDGDFILK